MAIDFDALDLVRGEHRAVSLDAQARRGAMQEQGCAPQPRPACGPARDYAAVCAWCMCASVCVCEIL